MLHDNLRIAAFALLIMIAGCSVSSEGLRGPFDGATDATTSGTTCPAGLTDQAGWPADSTATSCSRSCGPDDKGRQVCQRSEISDCRKKSGCLCLQAPCVACLDCVLANLPDCYIPTNASTAAACATEVSKGEACMTACDNKLCLRKDGKTACICNPQGKYACGDWNGSGWK